MCPAATRSGSATSCSRWRRSWRTRPRNGRTAYASRARFVMPPPPRSTRRGCAPRSPPWRRLAPAPESLVLRRLLGRALVLRGVLVPGRRLALARLALLVETDRHLDLGLPALAQEHHAHALAHRGGRHHALQIAGAFERRAVHGHEHVVRLHTAHRRRLAGHDAAHEHA